MLSAGLAQRVGLGLEVVDVETAGPELGADLVLGEWAAQSPGRHRQKADESLDPCSSPGESLLLLLVRSLSSWGDRNADSSSCTFVRTSLSPFSAVGATTLNAVGATAFGLVQTPSLRAFRSLECCSSAYPRPVEAANVDAMLGCASSTIPAGGVDHSPLLEELQPRAYRSFSDAHVGRQDLDTESIDDAGSVRATVERPSEVVNRGGGDLVAADHKAFHGADR